VVSSWHEAARPHARAVLVVSHDLDGLLRCTPCRFVAPCCRLWGSPRFRVLPLAVLGASTVFRLRLHPFPVAPDPSKCSPRHQLWSRHRDQLPSRCSSSLRFPLRDASAVLRFPPRASQPQGFAPLPSPLQARRRCRQRAARYSHGLRTIKVVHVSEVTHDVGRLRFLCGTHK